MKRTELTKLFSCVLVMLALGLTGCRNEDEPEENANKEQEENVEVEEPTEDTPFYEIKLTGAQAEIRDRNNDFAVEFFKAGQQTDNKVVSPFSVFTTLAMLANGDEGEVQEEILANFGLNKGEVSKLNSYVKTMNEGFSKLYGKTRFCYANSIWVKGGGDCLPGFEQTMKGYYGAEINELTDDGLRNMDIINGWISDNTNQLIKDFLTQPVSDAAIVNALYFKGGWQSRFLEENTQEAEFTNKDESRSRVPFMSSKDIVAFGQSEGATGVGLLLGKGNFRLTFIMADTTSVSSPLLDNLNGRSLTAFLSGMKNKRIHIRVPKFASDFKDGCASLIKSIGFTKVFDHAYRGIMVNKPLYFNELFHGARLQIDEAGVEGASASVVGKASWAGGPIPEFKDVTFDRPFIYVLEEVSTGTILFIGEVSKL